MTHNWCPEIYHGMFVDRVNDDKINVAPCCQAAGKIESVDGFDFQTSKHLSALRQQFDQNKKPEACDRCWKMEKLDTRVADSVLLNFMPARRLTIQFL